MRGQIAIFFNHVRKDFPQYENFGLGVSKMQGPQLEDGYTRIANEILERISQIPLNGAQFRILMVVWRYTYGFNRKEHELSNKFIEEASGLNKRQVRRELKRLIDMKILNVVKEATFTTARVLGFNKYFDSWQVTNQTSWGKKDHTPPDKIDPSSEDNSAPSPPDKLDLSPGGELAPQERQYKDNIKNNNKNNTTPLPPPGGNDDGGVVESEEVGKVYEFYQNNFGVMSPFTAEKIDDLIKDIGPAMVIEAMKIAVLNQSRRLSYVEGIVKNWLDHNIRDPSQMEAFNRERNKTFSKPIENQKTKEISEEDIVAAATYIEIELNEFKKIKKNPTPQQIKAFLNSNKFAYSAEVKRKAFEHLGLTKFLEGG